MSWQKVFKTARRLGAPVIVTDSAGQDPLIVLPLDIYEALMTDQDVAPKPPHLRGSEPDERTESVFEIPPEETLPVIQSKNIAEVSQKLKNKSENSEEGSETGENGEISLEERFYFEPLDDEIKK